MQQLQLFIEGERLDLFKDETISLTQSIQNVKDISKIFTDFSKTFNVPASKTNNKIFKHYYNYDIIGGFDGRKKKSAKIELNTLPFTDGKIKLEGVDLKNNVPHTYKITFFGSTVELKDILGEDKLTGLNTLTDLNKTYNAASIKTSLQDDPTTNDIIAPLITHTKRLYYESNQHVNGTGNLWYEFGTGSSHIHGVPFSELKYAIRLHSIIEAIEAKYTISFSNDFFVSTNEPYYNLFMWLHRKKGSVENLGNTNQSIMNGWTAEAEDTLTQTFLKSSTVLEVNGVQSQYTSNTVLNLYTNNATDPYSVSLQKNGVEVVSFSNVTGSLVIDQSMQGVGDYSIYIESNSPIAFTGIQWAFEYDRFGDGTQIVNKNYNTGAFNYVSEFVFDITQQIPDIKVIDFISGLFRMFNLTAYVEKNKTEITVKTLDSFYNDGISYDITKYIDTDKSQVNTTLPYRKINFKHEDTKTILAEKHTQQFGKNWGESEFTSGKKLDGSIYDIKTPFSQMKYERLIDANGDVLKDVQVGYFVDDNEESYYGKPLIFYPIRKVSSTAISFVSGDTTHESLTTYNIPSNSVALASSTSSYNMNFFAESNEYAALSSPTDNGFTNTLFEVYYKKYVVDIFNPSNRLTKVTAYLPLRILLNFNLSDRFVVNNRSFKINSINTNLQSGKSQIELLNDL